MSSANQKSHAETTFENALEKSSTIGGAKSRPSKSLPPWRRKRVTSRFARICSNRA